jgi:hypothetical protein
VARSTPHRRCMSPASHSAAPPPDTVSDALVLRPSRELHAVPASSPSQRATTLAPAGAESESVGAHLRRAFSDSPDWALIALAALATAGWLVERRRRRELQTERDSVLWAGVQSADSSIITGPDEPPRHDAAAADAPSLQAGEAALPNSPVSRREATLIDLQQLEGKLRRRRGRGDLLGAAVLLQQHLAEFRYTSPWVFLELRDIELLLDRGQEWELAREAFRARFGQRAPVWQAPSSADAELAEDALIAQELAAQWPYREARMVIRRWVLGDATWSTAEYHAPILALGVYRDLLFLDRLLDRVMLTRAEPVDSLL